MICAELEERGFYPRSKLRNTPALTSLPGHTRTSYLPGRAALWGPRKTTST